MWTSLSQQVSDAIEQSFQLEKKHEVSGGDISRAYIIEDRGSRFFVKLNALDKLEMFETELLALQSLADSETVAVPRPICAGQTKDTSFIVLEYLELVSGTDQQWFELGESLAKLHQYGDQAMYGWDTDNFIGKTPQPNRWCKKWCTFFSEERIGWQLELAEEKGFHFGDISQLVSTIKQLLSHHKVQPSLLHGDLWSGNIAFVHSSPVLFDPACYWGDREADIAMTELFGRLPEPFYLGYQEHWPLEKGYEQRKEIYNLYHLLNHCNLFGEQYYAEAKKVLASIMD